MKEEDILRKKLSTKENPFKVPENYFENFTSQMMDQLPEKPGNKIKNFFPCILLWCI